MAPVAALLSLAGCDDAPPRMAEGVFGPLGEPRPNATAEQRETFARGREVALRRFSRSDGLGPNFNVTFCGACHEKPVFGGSAGHYRDFLLVAQVLPDGSFIPRVANGVQPHYTVEDRGRLQSEPFINRVAGRNPIPFFGVGLLAEITDEEILRRADPDDADGDGISGRANFDRGFVGRFGRKAQTVSIEGFIRGPLFNHLGVTTNPLSAARQAQLPVPSISTAGSSAPLIAGGSIAGRTEAQAAAPDEPTTDVDLAPDPELSEDDLFDLVSFTMLLAAPEPDAPTDETRRGEAHFMGIGCADCHTPTLRSPRGLLPVYSDLLLHDMGPELDDGMEQGLATGSEFRTQPLWGVVAAAPYLHDGRAGTLDEAIRMHGGESLSSRQAYEALSDTERSELLAFLGSLGGRSQTTEGLVAPGAPIPSPGQPGAPVALADAAEEDRFLEGRAVFDRDMSITNGLGPLFNGDACRACHFDPVVGGAGTLDVDVIRHGEITGGTMFTAPAGGTIIHRFATDSTRPEPGMSVNFFEPRQTPSIIGLGLLERVPEMDIVALEDPMDMDMDGVSGRIHRLGDGRLGRLGWKAQVPNLAEFARDAMSAELGITLPNQPGLSFGVATDSDMSPDPEISAEDLEALVFFMSRLAPPPRTRTDMTLEDAGEAVFSSVRCIDCHVSPLMTDTGETIHPYTDLLLHDVAEDGAGGVIDGDATMTEFRTPPLWGIASTAPYMHDGRSETLEEAIAEHMGEADASRMLYEALDASDRAALLAFLRSL